MFSCEFAKSLRTPFLQNTPGRLRCEQGNSFICSKKELFWYCKFSVKLAAYKGLRCVKSLRIQSFSGSNFLAFGLNPENTDQKLSECGHFSRSAKGTENNCYPEITFWGEGRGKPYLSPSKPNSTVKTRTVYRGCNVCYQVFLENGRIDFKRKIRNFNINFQT